MSKMASRIAVTHLCFLLAAAVHAQGEPAAKPAVGVDTLLRSYLDLRSLARLSPNAVSLASSHDPLGANDDAGHFLRQEGTTAVLADVDGPGAIVRLWTTDPLGELKIYIDNAPTPVIDMPFLSISKGAAPFTSPLSGFSTGGDYSFLPIPYARHCKVVVENPGSLNYHSLYYQVNTVKFPPQTAVRSFTLPLPPSDQAAVDAVNTAWSGLTDPTASQPLVAKPITLVPGTTKTIASIKGPGTITRIRMALPGTANLDLRRMILRAYFDDHVVPDIQAPVGDFFGNPVERKPFRSLLLGCASDGTWTADFPMPFARSARFTLESRETHPAAAIFRADFTPGAFGPKTTGYFHAWWRQETTRPGIPHTWIKTTGQRGRVVGVTQNMAGTQGIGYLEGDDQFRVDSQSWRPAPAHPTTVIGPWNGTGTEDCFNSGGYFDHGPNGLPMNGLLEKWDPGLIVTYRWFVNEAPTFQNSIDGQLEHGGINDSQGEIYSSVTYWYSNGPALGTPALMGSQNLDSPETIVPQIFVPNAIEGESLTPTVTGGVFECQRMGAGWSGPYQLWWRGASKGDTLTASFTPPAAGTYELYGFLTKARDYGDVHFAVNGTQVGGIFDGYSPTLTPPAATDIGLVTLPAGPSRLVVTLTGQNPASVGTMFGLDCLVLTAPGAPAPAMVTQIR